MERFGYPDGREPEIPHCPVCGAECSDIYRDKHGDVFACDNCVNRIDAWEVEECFDSPI
jgi:hypothetical protein